MFFVLLALIVVGGAWGHSRFGLVGMMPAGISLLIVATLWSLKCL